MKPIGFKYDVEIRIELTRANLELLRTASESHYDSKVRSLSIPGIGAVLNGCGTMLIGSTADTVEADFTTDHLQLMVKSLEPVARWPNDEWQLSSRLRKLLQATMDEDTRVNHAAEAVPDSTRWKAWLGE